MYAITTNRSVLPDRRSPAAHLRVLEEDGDPVAWITIESFPTCPPDLLGSLPPTELVVTDLALEHRVPDRPLVGMINQAFEQARSDTSDYIRYRINPEFTSQPERKRRLVEQAGMELFQEKEGLHLGLDVTTDTGELEFRTLDEVGDEAFGPVIASIGIGTLDRNDRWFYNRAGATNWSKVFLSMCGREDRHSWLLALDSNDDPVGFIGVNEMHIDRPTAWDVMPCGTIAMTGVTPAHRGRGHIVAIINAGIEAAQRRGMRTMLDSVDVENGPMLAAMARCGYRSDNRPWHDWYYRIALSP